MGRGTSALTPPSQKASTKKTEALTIACNKVPLLQLLALHLLLFLLLVVEQGQLAQLAVEELEAGQGGIPVVGDAVLVRRAGSGSR
jgi:hypothetical protein